MSEYARSGVDHAGKDAGLGGMASLLRATYGNNPRARVVGGIGYYASLVEPDDGPLALAVSTDGVGTKVLVAQVAGVHDTVGIDCVANNANDVACVGADPLAMVDYIGVNFVDAAVVERLAAGLAEGARRAELSIPGGELAQVRDLLRGEGECHYDLIGTCIGVVPKGLASDGAAVVPGDVVVGIASTGLHSNGYTLARRVIFGTMAKRIDDRLPECGRTVAEELLEPTAMYVRECKALRREGVEVHALLNVTGGGFSNLLRVAATGVGFLLDALPEPPPIFQLLQREGRVSPAEMHQVFNMGVGFAVVVPPQSAGQVIAAAHAEGKRAWVVGRVVADPQKRVAVLRDGLAGALVAHRSKGDFVPTDEVPEAFRA